MAADLGRVVGESPALALRKLYACTPQNASLYVERWNSESSHVRLSSFAGPAMVVSRFSNCCAPPPMVKARNKGRHHAAREAMDRSQIMSSVRSKDTGPEMVVRRHLHRIGYRYQLHRRDLPGCPDLVFPSRRKVILVHGCFWHGHGCRWGRLPKSNLEYWKPKIEANEARDREVERRLREARWNALVVWQCELRQPDMILAHIVAFLEGFDSAGAGRAPSPREDLR